MNSVSSQKRKRSTADAAMEVAPKIIIFFHTTRLIRRVSQKGR